MKRLLFKLKQRSAGESAVGGPQFQLSACQQKAKGRVSGFEKCFIFSNLKVLDKCKFHARSYLRRHVIPTANGQKGGGPGILVQHADNTNNVLVFGASMAPGAGCFSVPASNKQHGRPDVTRP